MRRPGVGLGGLGMKRFARRLLDRSCNERAPTAVAAVAAALELRRRGRRAMHREKASVDCKHSHGVIAAGTEAQKRFDLCTGGGSADFEPGHGRSFVADSPRLLGRRPGVKFGLRYPKHRPKRNGVLRGKWKSERWAFGWSLNPVGSVSRRCGCQGEREARVARLIAGPAPPGSSPLGRDLADTPRSPWAPPACCSPNSSAISPVSLCRMQGGVRRPRRVRVRHQVRPQR